MNHGDLWFVALAALTVASPGPGVLMTLDNAVQRGWRASMHGVVGLAVGAALMAVLSAAGVGWMLRSSELAFDALRLASAAYLLYLAVKAWTRSIELPATGEKAGMSGSEKRALFLRGVMLQTSNPKSLLFFIAVLPPMLQGQPSLARYALPITVYCALLLSIHAAYAGVATRARRWLAHRRNARWLARASAVTFLCFALTVLGAPPVR